jgi:hypothetical protein
MTGSDMNAAIKTAKILSPWLLNIYSITYFQPARSIN